MFSVSPYSTHQDANVLGYNVGYKTSTIHIVIISLARTGTRFPSFCLKLGSFTSLINTTMNFDFSHCFTNGNGNNIIN